MVNKNTAIAVPNINQAELIARLPPEQQRQLFKIEQGIVLQEHRRKIALEFEDHQSRNASMLANQDHQNKLTQIRHQADREDQRAAMKGQTAATLADQAHGNQLEQKRADLKNHIALAEFNTGLSIITTLMEEDGKVRASMLARMEKSHEVREEVFKMRAEAVIQEKQTQKQHLRDLEKMQLASSLKQSEQYFQSICLRLSKLLDDSQDDKAEKEENKDI